MKRYGLYSLLMVILWLMVACQPSAAPLPTLVQVSGEIPPGLPEASTDIPVQIITRTPLPERVGVPTPTPEYRYPGTYIRQLSATTDEDFRAALAIDEAAHLYTFEALQNDLITLELKRFSGGFDPLLRLYQPDSTLIAMDDNSAGEQNARLTNIRLPETGLYTIQISGKVGAGEYQLRLRRGEQTILPDVIPIVNPTPTLAYLTPTPGTHPQTRRLVPHQPVYDDLSRAGDFSRYVFYAEADSPFSISVMPIGQSRLRADVEVYGPEGNLIASAKSSADYRGGTLILAQSAPQTGTYLVFITGEVNTTGAYVLSYGENSSHLDLFQREMPVNERQTGVISQQGIRHIWRIPVLQGDVITAALSPNSPDFDPVLEIVNSAGEVLYSDDNGGGNRSALIRFAEITSYDLFFLRVRDASGEYAGKYTLIWRYVETAPTPTPPPIQTTVLSVRDSVPMETYQFYAFQGRKGWHIHATLDALPDSTLDPVLALLDPDGNIIAESDDSDTGLNPELTIILPDDGTYQLRVNGYLSEGTFDLQATVLLDR